MKKLFLLFFFALSIAGLRGQSNVQYDDVTYYNYLDSTSTWYWRGPSNGPYNAYITYYFCGDTVLDGQAYYKQYYVQGVGNGQDPYIQTTGPQFYRYIREDAQHRFWIYNHWNNTERLWVDFTTMAPGMETFPFDTICVGGTEDTVYLGSQPLRRITSQNQASYTLVEGIGNTRLEGNCGPITTTSYWMACYKKQNNYLCFDPSSSTTQFPDPTTPIAILTQPTSATICPHTNFTLSINISGYANYQWVHNGTNVASGIYKELSLNNVQPADTGTYYVRVSSPMFGTIISDTVTINILPPVVTQQPVSQTVCNSNNTVVFTTLATGTNQQYQWFRNNSSITGATNDTLTIVNATTANAGNYVCRITSGTCIENTQTATLTISSAVPNITIQPYDKNACVGQNVLLSTSASGGTITYAWYRNGMQVYSGNSGNFTIPSATLNSAGNYYCVATNGCGSDITDTIQLTIYPNDVTITAQSADTLILCNTGNQLSLFVSATGTVTGYQWEYAQTPINGAPNSPNFVINAPSSLNSGNYRCVLQTYCGPVVSGTMYVQVVDTTVITNYTATYATNTIWFTGQTNNTGLNGLQYVWLFNGVVIDTSYTFSYSMPYPDTPGYLTVQILGSCTGNIPADSIFIEPLALPETGADSYIYLCPNPAGNLVTIKTNKNYSNASVCIYSATGQLVQSEKLNIQSAQTIALNKLANGLYSVIISDAQGNLVFKHKLVVSK